VRPADNFPAIGCAALRSLAKIARVAAITKHTKASGLSIINCQIITKDADAANKGLKMIATTQQHSGAIMILRVKRCFVATASVVSAVAPTATGIDIGWLWRTAMCYFVHRNIGLPQSANHPPATFEPFGKREDHGSIFLSEASVDQTAN
jgi:hypothetical protein